MAMSENTSVGGRPLDRAKRRLREADAVMAAWWSVEGAPPAYCNPWC
jgi:hypothetical protein